MIPKQVHVAGFTGFTLHNVWYQYQYIVRYRVRRLHAPGHSVVISTYITHHPRATTMSAACSPVPRPWLSPPHSLQGAPNKRRWVHTLVAPCRGGRVEFRCLAGRARSHHGVSGAIPVALPEGVAACRGRGHVRVRHSARAAHAGAEAQWAHHRGQGAARRPCDGVCAVQAPLCRRVTTIGRHLAHGALGGHGVHRHVLWARQEAVSAGRQGRVVEAPGETAGAQARQWGRRTCWDLGLGGAVEVPAAGGPPLGAGGA